MEYRMRIITVTRVGKYEPATRANDILEAMRLWDVHAMQAVDWVQCKGTVYRRGHGIIAERKAHFPHCANIKVNLWAYRPSIASSRNVHIKLFASGKMGVTGLQIGRAEVSALSDFMWNVFCLRVIDIEPVMYKVGYVYPQMIDQTTLCRYLVTKEFKFLAELFITIEPIVAIRALFGIGEYNGTKIAIELQQGTTKINAFSTGSVMMSAPSLPLIYTCWDILKMALEMYAVHDFDAMLHGVPDPDADAGDQERNEEGAPLVDVVAAADAAAAALGLPAPGA